ncbi:hypothetical protein [Chryseobacterium sp. ISL-6]|uniref:hypothetical protein n=1 Tax=Chryseobacterium sp. ISL-6 TaxID=2819143 RepID=UPI001BE806E3|nr:hypothetical protein [Chryseobacterium sp. ISL-6]MBT2619697.1 hypothetical protein [Chryseobacterium sp. ISL-6]
MQSILKEDVFSAPRWQKTIYRFVSLLMLILGGYVLTIKNVGWIIFLAPFIFLIAVSMFIYTRVKLIISNDGVRFVGGLKKHSFLWSDITQIDMVRLGKFKTPSATIYYSGGKLELNMSVYLKPEFNKILSLLEMKVDSVLFTENYKEVRGQIS